jgi:cytochrome c oxidase assembly protein subunit 11
MAPIKQSFMNLQMLSKLIIIVVGMFGFGYALVPIYKAICEATGINVLERKTNSEASFSIIGAYRVIANTLGLQAIAGSEVSAADFAKNTQVDLTRKVTIEFDANSRGTWLFKPRSSSVQIHPGELATMVYELQSTEGQVTKGQAIASYAPKGTGTYFHKLECFCFKEQSLKARETREFPVVFVIDPKLPKDITTITLSYTFFDVGLPGGIAKPAAPTAPSRFSGDKS